jgi:(p)ppGpp synthase/HD superfamily hydrolase
MKTHENMLLLLEAMEFASYRLKYETTKNDEPYLNHVIQVCSLLSTIGEVKDIDILRASILYELIGRSNVKPVDIHLRFGPRTYAIVRKLNLERSFSLNKEVVFQESYAGLNEAANVIRLADLIANVEMMVSCPPTGWDIERRNIFLEWSAKCINDLKDTCPQLEEYYHCIYSTDSSEDLQQNNWKKISA